MKLSELSELHLAAVVAIATFLGGVGSAMINTFWTDAGTERQTAVQLVQLAIGILSEPIAASAKRAVGPAPTSQTVLRTWAVDIINQSAEVKFDEEAKHLLVNGYASFPLVDAKAQAEVIQEAIRTIEAEMAGKLRSAE